MFSLIGPASEIIASSAARLAIGGGGEFLDGPKSYY
jgi:hypothetical protein